MNAETFIAAANHFFKDFAYAVGTPAKLIQLAAPTASPAPCAAWLRRGGCLR